MSAVGRELLSLPVKWSLHGSSSKLRPEFNCSLFAPLMGQPAFLKPAALCRAKRDVLGKAFIFFSTSCDDLSLGEIPSSC